MPIRFLKVPRATMRVSAVRALSRAAGGRSGARKVAGQRPDSAQDDGLLVQPMLVVIPARGRTGDPGDLAGASQRLIDRGLPHTINEERSMSSQTFTVSGMTCEHCVRAVTAEFSRMPGVTAVAVDLASGTVTVHSERPINTAEAATAADEAGYELAS